METDKIYTLSEIKKLFTDEQPKFIALKNVQGQFVVHYNPANMKANVRMLEIERAFRKQTVPDGIYFFAYRNSVSKNSTENQLPVAKGNVSKETINLPVLSNNVTPPEIVFTQSKAVEVLTEKNRLELENAELKRRLGELESELSEETETATPVTNGKEVIDGLKDLVNLCDPFLDRFFKLKEREIAIKEKGLNGKAAVNDQQHKRADGGIKIDSELYPNYFDQIFNSLDDAALQKELDLLETHNVDLYNQYISHYQISIDEDEPGN